MTIKETYFGLFNQNQLFSTFQFLAFSPTIKIDKVHDTITLSNPSDALTKLVIDIKDLATKGNQITGGTITGVEFISHSKHALDFTGLKIDAVDANAAISHGFAGAYDLLADNLHGSLVAKGDKYDNIIEIGGGTGGGTATVDAGAGDDTIQIWHKRTATIDGGTGTDTLDFSSFASYHPAVDATLTIDLAAGTGTNLYGGALKIKNVENVTNMFNGLNILKGDGHANVFYGGAGADTLWGRGGNDDIYIRRNYSADPRKISADGGSGKDTLHAELSEAPGASYTGLGDSIRFHNKLDVEHQSSNLGTFHGGTFKNFETFRVDGFLNKDVFDFAGSDANENVYAAGSDDPLNGRGGDDLLFGGLGADHLTGGSGADKFQYSSTAESTLNPMTRDEITDFKHAQHDKIDLHLIDANRKTAANDTFKFIENKAFDGHAGEVRYVHSGTSTFIFVDDNGDKTPDMAILLDHGPTKMFVSDFIL